MSTPLVIATLLAAASVAGIVVGLTRARQGRLSLAIGSWGMLLMAAALALGEWPKKGMVLSVTQLILVVASVAVVAQHELRRRTSKISEPNEG